MVLHLETSGPDRDTDPGEEVVEAVPVTGLFCSRLSGISGTADNNRPS